MSKSPNSSSSSSEDDDRSSDDDSRTKNRKTLDVQSHKFIRKTCARGVCSLFLRLRSIQHVSSGRLKERPGFSCSLENEIDCKRV